jgi:hypothetical protein
MSTAGFYLTQAEQCAKAAADTLLDNQRDKYLRAQAAWQALADREDTVKAARDKRDAEKAEQAEMVEMAELALAGQAEAIDPSDENEPTIQ